MKWRSLLPAGSCPRRRGREDVLVWREGNDEEERAVQVTGKQRLLGLTWDVMWSPSSVACSACEPLPGCEALDEIVSRPCGPNLPGLSLRFPSTSLLRQSHVLIDFSFLFFWLGEPTQRIWNQVSSISAPPLRAMPKTKQQLSFNNANPWSGSCFLLPKQSFHGPEASASDRFNKELL